MKNGTWLVAAVVALVGCGSSAAQMQHMANDCDKKITVQVIGGKLNFDPPRACFKNKNTKVTWEFVSFQKGDYVFKADSVVIVGDTFNDFPNCNARSGGRGGVEDEGNKLTCDDINSQPGEYDYRMTVYFPVGSSEAANSDPTIVNQ